MAVASSGKRFVIRKLDLGLPDRLEAGSYCLTEDGSSPFPAAAHLVIEEAEAPALAQLPDEAAIVVIFDPDTGIAQVAWESMPEGSRPKELD